GAACGRGDRRDAAGARADDLHSEGNRRGPYGRRRQRRLGTIIVLRGIHPLLGPELLAALAAMGHGDELAIVDANFPAASVGRRVLHVACPSARDALDAVLTLFPLDTLVQPAAFTMEVVDDPDAVPDPVREFAAVFT